MNGYNAFCVSFFSVVEIYVMYFYVEMGIFNKLFEILIFLFDLMI